MDDKTAILTGQHGRGPDRVDGFNASARVCFARARYTTKADVAADDIIGLVQLPEGAVPIPHLSSVASSGGVGTALTCQVGTVADPDMLAGTLALSHAANPIFQRFDQGGYSLAMSGQTEFAAPTDITAKVIAATSVNAGVHVDFLIAYLLR